MCAVGLHPGGHGACFETVAAADDGLEVRDGFAFGASGGFLGGEGHEGFGDQSAGCGTQAIVVEDQVLQGYMLCEEGLEGRDGVEAKSIVGEVDGVEVREG